MIFVFKVYLTRTRRSFFITLHLLGHFYRRHRWTYLFSTRISSTVSANHTFLGLTSPPKTCIDKHNQKCSFFPIFLVLLYNIQCKYLCGKHYQKQNVVTCNCCHTLPAICLMMEYNTISAPWTPFLTICLIIHSNWNIPNQLLMYCISMQILVNDLQLFICLNLHFFPCKYNMVSYNYLNNKIRQTSTMDWYSKCWQIPTCDRGTSSNLVHFS